MVRYIVSIEVDYFFVDSNAAASVCRSRIRPWSWAQWVDFIRKQCTCFFYAAIMLNLSCDTPLYFMLVKRIFATNRPDLRETLELPCSRHLRFSSDWSFCLAITSKLFWTLGCFMHLWHYLILIIFLLSFLSRSVWTDGERCDFAALPHSCITIKSS